MAPSIVSASLRSTDEAAIGVFQSIYVKICREHVHTVGPLSSLSNNRPDLGITSYNFRFVSAACMHYMILLFLKPSTLSMRPA